MTYAFYFDSTYCSGCKACQAACKDKNDLPAGVLWRRVYEVSGGTWEQSGDAWNNTVFAYNLSLACNHCVHPKCAGVCPVDAYYVRDDGIVILDSSKCVGCGYCAWACPYGAPQYNPQTGSMTKCDFCYDNLDQGQPPACVAACPMRVLDYGEAETREGMELWNTSPETHPFPLPMFSHTRPHLAIQPHAAMQTSQEKFVANQEEIQPRTPSAWEDVPLIFFTLLGQLAVGGFWVMWILTDRGIPTWNLLPHLIIGTSLGIGVFSSFAHLGTKKNAWRVLSHLSHSWLSREILFAGLFGLSWLTTALVSVTGHQVMFEAMAVTSIFGIGLVYSMSQVYRIPAAPGWNTWRTNAGFVVSALLLGLSVMAPMFLDTGFPFEYINIGILVLLLVEILLIWASSKDRLYQNLRKGLMFLGILLSIFNIVSSADVLWLSILVFVFVAMEEGLGRWLFYRSRLA